MMFFYINVFSGERTKSATGGAICKVNTNHRGGHVKLESVAIMIEN